MYTVGLGISGIKQAENQFVGLQNIKAMANAGKKIVTFLYFNS